MKAIFALTALAAFAAAPVLAQEPAPAPAPAAAQAPPGNAAHGKALVLADGCYQCHGTNGIGGSDRTGPRIAPNPIPWAAFINQLRNPRQQMAIYTRVVLPDQDAADIYAYLKSQPQPKKVADIPLLNNLH